MSDDFAPNLTQDPVAAAGRSISGANADRLMSVHTSLVQSEQSLAEVLRESGYLSAPRYPAPPFTKVQAAALSVADELAVRTWEQRVNTAIALCYQRFAATDSGEDLDAVLATTIAVLTGAIGDLPPPAGRDHLCASHLEFELDYWQLYGDPDFSEPMGAAIADRVWQFRLVTLLRFFANRFFAVTRTAIDPTDGLAALVSEFEALLRSMLTDHTGGFDQPVTVESEIEIENEDLMEAAAQPEEPIEVQAAAGEYEAVWGLALAARAVDLDAAAEDDDAVPIEGVLFRVDEPSECTPEVGPRLPLFISNEVAAAALRHVIGRPLDAHESLEAHGGGVVGAITEGAVRDRDAVVSGFLHAHHSPQQVREIRAAAREGQLGMSMLGTVSWHRGEIDGREVAVVDRLKLKGGTILRAAVATYQKTRVKLLSAVDRAGRSLPLAAAVPVAASTHQPIEPLDSDIPMTTETPTVAELTTELTDKLLTAIEALGSRLGAIEEKQSAAEQAEADRLAAEQAAAAEAAAVEAMAQKVAAAIAPSIDERIAAVMGQRPVAQRRSVATPVVPGAAPTPVAAGAASPEVSALLAQLDRIPAHNIAGRIALKQRIADLERNAAISR